mmetsp:Transcript_19600/g.45101  ORF Transcript_19600/g.45101 Transcript_19600/m.45101 type:complete len:266 (-) Transcript_19600:264-1061(-)
MQNGLPCNLKGSPVDCEPHVEPGPFDGSITDLCRHLYLEVASGSVLAQILAVGVGHKRPLRVRPRAQEHLVPNHHAGPVLPQPRDVQVVAGLPALVTVSPVRLDQCDVGHVEIAHVRLHLRLLHDKQQLEEVLVVSVSGLAFAKEEAFLGVFHLGLDLLQLAFGKELADFLGESVLVLAGSTADEHGGVAPWALEVHDVLRASALPEPLLGCLLLACEDGRRLKLLMHLAVTALDGDVPLHNKGLCLAPPASRKRHLLVALEMHA